MIIENWYDLRFLNPSHLGDVIRLEAEVTQTMDARKIIVLDVRLWNMTHEQMAARGRIQVQISEES